MKIYLSIIWDYYFSIISVKWFTFLNYCCIGVFYDGSWSTFLLNIQASFCHFLVRHGKIISKSFHQKVRQHSILSAGTHTLAPVFFPVFSKKAVLLSHSQINGTDHGFLLRNSRNSSELPNIISSILRGKSS